MCDSVAGDLICLLRVRSCVRAPDTREGEKKILSSDELEASGLDKLQCYFTQSFLSVVTMVL